MQVKYNFEKLCNARSKVHSKVVKSIDDNNILNKQKYLNKYEHLTSLIDIEITNYENS